MGLSKAASQGAKAVRPRRFALVLVGLFIDQIKGIKRRWLATVDQLLVLIIKVIELIEHVLFD